MNRTIMKGILFTEPLFHKVVNGTKTQTRRVMKPQPIDPITKENQILYKPRYKPDETLYLKEPYRIIYPGENTFEIELQYTGKKYLYDYHAFANTVTIKTWVEKRLEEQKKSAWCNKLFMPQFASKHFIEITGVRCERLQDISDADCVKEGITINPDCDNDVRDEKILVASAHYIAAYANLIDKINGKGTWERNPYVWVYDFKLSLCKSC